MSGSFVLPAADVVAQWTDDESCGSTEEALHMRKVVAITCEMDPIGFAQEALLLNSNFFRKYGVHSYRQKQHLFKGKIKKHAQGHRGCAR